MFCCEAFARRPVCRRRAWQCSAVGLPDALRLSPLVLLWANTAEAARPEPGRRLSRYPADCLLGCPQAAVLDAQAPKALTVNQVAAGRPAGLRTRMIGMSACERNIASTATPGAALRENPAWRRLASIQRSTESRRASCRAVTAEAVRSCSSPASFGATSAKPGARLGLGHSRSRSVPPHAARAGRGQRPGPSPAGSSPSSRGASMWERQLSERSLGFQSTAPGPFRAGRRRCCSAAPTGAMTMAEVPLKLPRQLPITASCIKVKRS